MIRKKKPSQKRVNKLPLGSGMLGQTAAAIKKRKKKQADIMRKLGK